MDKEYFINKTKNVSLNIINTTIDSIREKNTIRKSVRVLKDGKMGISGSRSDLPFEELEQNAISMIDIELPKGFDFQEGSKREWNIIKKDFSNDEIMNIADNVLKQLKEKFPDYIFSNKIGYDHNSMNVKNSKNIDYTVETNGIYLAIIFKHKKSNSIMDGFLGKQYFDTPDVDEYIGNYSKYLTAFNNEVSFDKDKAIIVFPGYTNSMPYAFLTKHINGELYERGASYFSSKKNEKLFNDKFSMYDININKENGICNPFDADGFLRKEKELPIFENGVFKSPLYDLKRAIIYNTKPTGTSIRSYNTGSSIKPNFLFVPSIDKKLEDIDECIIPVMAAGGDFQDNGDISMPLQLAYLVRKGKFIGKIPQIILTANIDNLFNNDYIGALKDSFFKNDINKYMAFRMSVNKG